MEHVNGVQEFLAEARKLLRPDGLLIVAVPPIYHAESRAANLANPFHVNIWSPRQWHYTLQQYFAEVRCIRHHFEKPGVALDFFDTPETTPLTENDFLFLPSSVAELSAIGALTAIFVAAKPLPDAAAIAPQFIDDSFTRLPPQAPGWSEATRLRMIEYWHRFENRLRIR